MTPDKPTCEVTRLQRTLAAIIEAYANGDSDKDKLVWIVTRATASLAASVLRSGDPEPRGGRAERGHSVLLGTQRPEPLSASDSLTQPITASPQGDPCEAGFLQRFAAEANRQRDAAIARATAAEAERDEATRKHESVVRQHALRCREVDALTAERDGLLAAVADGLAAKTAVERERDRLRKALQKARTWLGGVHDYMNGNEVLRDKLRAAIDEADALKAAPAPLTAAEEADEAARRG